MSTKHGVWLIGSTSEEIVGSKLPSSRQVFSKVLINTITVAEPFEKVLQKRHEKLQALWVKARIPPHKECHIIKKIEQMHT